MQPIHTPYLAADRIAGLRREADAQHAARRQHQDRDDRDPAPQPQPWPRLFQGLVGLAGRILIAPLRVELR